MGVGAASGDAEAVSEDGAALEGEIKGEATGCQPGARLGRLGWASRAFSFVLFWVVGSTAPIDFSGTIRRRPEPVIPLAGNDSMPPY
jgi:hypothetical protein